MVQTKWNQYYYRFSWIQLLRPMTLSGTISPICVSTLFILWRVGSIQWTPFFLLLVGAVFIQMSTNVWNDYFDFKKGQDQIKWQQKADNRYHPAHRQLPGIAITLTSVALVLGLFLAIFTTFWVILIGIFGIIGGFYYSAGNPSLSQVGLGELTAAVFLGFATILLPFIVQDVLLLPDMILLAIPFALLISTMILTNNIRDIDKDQAFRKTIPIIIERKKAILVLKLLLMIIYIWMFTLIWFKILPPWSMFIVVGLPIVYRLLRCFKKDETDPACMKYAAWHHWVLGLVLIAALIITIVFH